MLANVKRVLGAAVAAALIGFGGSAAAAPIINLSLQARVQGSGSAYTSNLDVTGLASGTILEYRLVADMLAAPVVNDDRTYATSSDTDGINSLPTLNVNVADGQGVRASILSAQLVNNWGAGTGTTAGAVSSTALTGIRAVQTSGVWVAKDPLSVVEGTLSLGSQGDGTAGTIGITIAPSAASGSFRVNTPAQQTFVSNGSESDGDPFLEYTPLTLTVVPEPASLSLLGMGAVALLGRRRKNA